MGDEWKGLILVLLLVAYFIFMAVVITVGTVKTNERESVCIALDYEDYDQSYKACRSGTNPIILRPYDMVFAGGE